MPLFDVRDLVQYPAGENSTDVLINGVHFNLTALNFFNYTLYSNGTLSNNSKCYLTFDAFKPTMLMNGTFINGTSCYDPYYGIRERGSLGITFACLFAASIMFTLINLRKHGRLFLPSEKRFRAIGRRWTWYWMLFVAACGIISGITSVDVDRDYLQSIAIVLQSFFYYLMMPGILAVVWEAVRHWGSWQERQIYDEDAFVLPQDDRRGRKEFYMPLVFYLLTWLNFFMTIPRSWTAIELQRSPQQEITKAKPSGTDTRFKTAAILTFLAWCLICYSLEHSIHYYKPKNRGPWNSFSGFMHYAPTKFLLTIPLLLIRIGYAIASSFEWTISPLKFNSNAAWMYGLGYAPTLLIIVVFEIWGYLDANEDRALLKMRAERGRSIDAELGIRKKPHWWRRMTAGGDYHLSAEQRLKNMTGEIGGGRATGRNLQRAVEMGNMPPAAAAARPDDDGGNPFSDEAAPAYYSSGRTGLTTVDDSEDTVARAGRRPSDGSDTAGSEGTVNTVAGRPQQVRSMLDI